MARGTAPPLDPEKLRDARATARLSQRQLATALGIDRRRVIGYEAGAERPELARLAALAHALNVGVVDLVVEDSLPAGLAGLRTGAGLTMAAGAAALGAALGPDSGIAANRASLSGAERGRMPLSWQGQTAGGQVREAMGTAYRAGGQDVASAWEHTFATAPSTEDRPELDAVAETAPPTPAAADTGPGTGPPLPVSYLWRGATLTRHGTRLLVTREPEPDARGLLHVHMREPTGAGAVHVFGPEEEIQIDAGVSVLVRGDPDQEPARLWLYLHGGYIGHMEDLHTWADRSGWAFYAAHAGPGAPEAATSLREVTAAVRQLLGEAYPEVDIEAVYGQREGPGWPSPGEMERWELYRGRAAGRQDVYVRGVCWGWLQRAGGAYTAHTPAGPVPGPAHPSKSRAVAALWAHLTAPLPPPRWGERARVRRGLRTPFDLRPGCPFTAGELARHTLVADGEPGVYQVRVADQLIGWVRRNDHAKADRRWQAHSQGRGRREASTRAAAVQALLAQPGPLWADPAHFLVH